MGHINDLDDDALFATTFPLPFRVLFLVGVGILGWATNLHGLDCMGINAAQTLELSSPDAYGHKHKHSIPIVHSGYRLIFSDPSVFYTAAYKLFSSYAAWCTFCWILFRVLTHGGNTALVDVFGFIPAVASLFVLVALICPVDVFQKRERDMFLLAIRRCLVAPAPIYFADVVFADVFTSFAKVLGDVWLSLLMILPGNTMLVAPSADGWGRWIVPTIMSLPYLIRLRQCLAEYTSDTNTSRRPLFNAIKYATSFPVIFLSAAQRIVVDDLMGERDMLRTQHPLFNMWLLAAAVNSLYSFWWDVTFDWGLELLKPKKDDSRASPPRALLLPELHSRSSSLTGGALTPPPEYVPATVYPWGLRPVLLYPLPVYPLLIFLNLILRLTWSVKLSSHLYSRSDGSLVIFWLEVAEIVRRWMWVFVRVEWESVRKTSDRSPFSRSTDALSGEDDEYEMVGTREDDHIA